VLGVSVMYLCVTSCICVLRHIFVC